MSIKYLKKYKVIIIDPESERPRIDFINRNTGLDIKNISKTLVLLDDGSTIPFISRYRKEMTGSLDEVEVANINNAYNLVKELIDRK